MASKFRICIKHADGHHVTLLPGGHGERDMVEEITSHVVEKLKALLVERVVEKGVGFWKTEAHVVEDLLQTLNEPHTREAVSQGVQEVLTELKSEVRPV